MNARNAIATLILSAAIVAPAAASISTGNLGQDVQSALDGSGNVSVRLEDGVATLWGHVGDVGTKHRVHQAALAHENVERVVDLITY